jgi:hypothetical protein
MDKLDQMVAGRGTPVERFEVKQEQDDIWIVSSQGRTLYLYSSEEEARWAALILASDACENGSQAKVVISAQISHNCRFTGM